MPWCPKCKNEYREGSTVCAECKEPLLDEIVEDVGEEETQLKDTINLRGPAKIYMKKEEKYKDLHSTAYTFLIFGIAGLAFVAANGLGIINFLNGMLAYVLYTVIFAGCILVAVTSFKDAKKAKDQIQEEEDLTRQVNDWLEANISEETFAEAADESLGEEVNYLNKLEYMHKLLLKEFPQLDEDYADQLCEEYYGKKFD